MRLSPGGVMAEAVLAGVGGGDDGADGLLVEALETAVALEILEVAAQRALLGELLKLFMGDQAS